MSCEMKTDVIIPVYKPGKELYEQLRRLLVQTSPVHRIIIMNTERQYFDDALYKPLFENTGTQLTVLHLSKQEFDHGRTRHQAMTESDAEVCVLMTQDAVPKDRHLIEKLLEALASDPSAAVAYARQLPAADCGMVERYTRDFNYPAESKIKTEADLPVLGIKTYLCSNVCAAYKREVYMKLGGFIRKTIFNEDMIYAAKAIQAGCSIVYAADALVVHSHNYTALEQLHRNFDLAVSQADHPEVFANLPSEGEGIRLVRSTAGYLLKHGRWYLIPDLVIKSGFKYLGYRLGKAYRCLPRALVLRLTMNRSYWE